MTQEQYNYLIRFKEHMRLAYESGYCRNILKRDRTKLKGIIEALTKEKYLKNIYCNSCVVDMLLIIKNHFDKYEEKLNQKKEKEDENKEV